MLPGRTKGMKIGIDVSQVVFGGGVGVYTRELVKALFKVDQENEYILFFSSLRRQFPGLQVGALAHSRVKIKKFKIPPTGLDFLWNKLHIAPIEWFIGEIDVFHSSDWTQPPTKKAKLVTTIHDLSFLRWPETVHPKVLTVQKRRLDWVKKEVDIIIAVSRATKKEIIELLGIEEERIRVVYEGVPRDVEKFKLKFKLKEVESLREKLKSRYKIDRPYLFAYGSRAPRKNIKRLIGAFREIREIRDKYQLVIVGDYQPEEKLPNNVVLTGFLPREEMLALFAGATALVYPSLYEGFGLPILEAFALGVPVITSNCSSMAEVASKAAILVDPNSTESIARGIKTVLNSELIREKLIEAGKQRARQFSWERAAKETLKIYQFLISNF